MMRTCSTRTLVEREGQAPNERLYRVIKAHERSVVVQRRVDAEGIAAIIRARRG